MSDVTKYVSRTKGDLYYRLLKRCLGLLEERQHLRELARAATDPDSTKKDTKRALDQLVRDALEES